MLPYSSVAASGSSLNLGVRLVNAYIRLKSQCAGHTKLAWHKRREETPECDGTRRQIDGCCVESRGIRQIDGSLTSAALQVKTRHRFSSVMVQTWISFSAPPVDQFLRERTQHDISISCNIIFHFVFPLRQQLEQLSCHVATRCSNLRSFYPQSMKTCRMSSCVSILRCDASALSPLPPPRACMNTGLPRLPASSTCKRSARCVDYPQSRLLCNPFVRGCLHALTQVSISCGCCFWTACRSVVTAATFS